MRFVAFFLMMVNISFFAFSAGRPALPGPYQAPTLSEPVLKVLQSKVFAKLAPLSADQARKVTALSGALSVKGFLPDSFEETGDHIFAKRSIPRKKLLGLFPGEMRIVTKIDYLIDPRYQRAFTLVPEVFKLTLEEAHSLGFRDHKAETEYVAICFSENQESLAYKLSHSLIPCTEVRTIRRVGADGKEILLPVLFSRDVANKGEALTFNFDLGVSRKACVYENGQTKCSFLAPKIPTDLMVELYKQPPFRDGGLVEENFPHLTQGEFESLSEWIDYAYWGRDFPEAFEIKVNASGVGSFFLRPVRDRIEPGSLLSLAVGRYETVRSNKSLLSHQVPVLSHGLNIRVKHLPYGEIEMRETVRDRALICNLNREGNWTNLLSSREGGNLEFTTRHVKIEGYLYPVLVLRVIKPIRSGDELVLTLPAEAVQSGPQKRKRSQL